MKRIREEMPELNIVLGLSNISFGLKPAARQVLNSVFLDLAVKAGMSAAIVHVSKLLPLHKLAANEIKVAEDLLLDRRAEGYDPLTAFIALFVDRQAEEAKAARALPTTVEERLQLRIVDGNRQGLDIDLEEALKTHAPLAIVNEILLAGMKTVGELFGSGKMQLPFVLQSAETMKAAVAYLEPKMEKKDGGAKGTIVLATVQGDVHDIGKNLVDIILSNNGYRVINIGIKQPISAIIEALKEHKPDALGLSGLLVKSTVIMRENLEELGRQGFDLPVLLGGAALTRNYVEADCVAAYPAGRVAYAGDAFDGLDLMAKVADKNFDAYLADRQTAKANRPAKKVKEAGVHASAESVRALKSQLAADHVIPKPPFWGASLVEDVPLKSLLPYLNRRTLYQFQWGYTKEGKTLAEWEAWAEKELTPTLNAIFRLCEKDAILTPKACYGYFKAKSEGDKLRLFDESGTRELTSFTFPRQSGDGGLCLADYIAEDELDVVALQIVTMGKRVTEVANAWKNENRYQDYLHLHGFGVEMAEAMAEYMHKRIRAELGFAAEEARDIERLLKQEYRGARYSFGYPACPNLADQKQLLELLGAERIGVALTEGDQLDPEQSTSALVLHHPKATYFKI
jgi:5-methyltetrahydrofolate--homocysteine methyltransferase